MDPSRFLNFPTVEISAFDLRVLREQAGMLKEYQKLAGDQYVQLQNLTASVTRLNLVNAQLRQKSEDTIKQMKKAREEVELVVDLMKDLHERNEALTKQNGLLKENIQLTKEKSGLLLEEAKKIFRK